MTARHCSTVARGDLDRALAMTERLIVIGGGGAGISAATTAKRVDPDLKVSLYTEFEDIAYSPCGIPFVYGGEIPRFEDLFLSTVDRYVSDGLDMRMETVVTDLDLDRGTITARNQHEGFDKLIVATGFVWEKPDVPGANLEGLHYVKNIRKAMEFDKVLETVKTVAVVGATPLGVEMAGNLGQRGLEVHFIDEGPWVLHEVLDPDVAEPGPRVADQARRDAAPGDRGRGLRGRRPRARGRHLAGRDRLRRRDRLPAQGAQHRARPGRRARGRDDRRARRRRPHADERRRRLGGGRRHRGPPRADDDPDPRAHRLARVRPGPHRGRQRRRRRPHL